MQQITTNYEIKLRFTDGDGNYSRGFAKTSVYVIDDDNPSGNYVIPNVKRQNFYYRFTATVNCALVVNWISNGKTGSLSFGTYENDAYIDTAWLNVSTAEDNYGYIYVIAGDVLVLKLQDAEDLNGSTFAFTINVNPFDNLVAAPDVALMRLAGQINSGTNLNGNIAITNGDAVNSFKCVYTSVVFTSDWSGGQAGTLLDLGNGLWAIKNGRYQARLDDPIIYTGNTTGEGYSNIIGFFLDIDNDFSGNNNIAIADAASDNYGTFQDLYYMYGDGTNFTTDVYAFGANVYMNLSDSNSNLYNSMYLFQTIINDYNAESEAIMVQSDGTVLTGTSGSPVNSPTQIDSLYIGNSGDGGIPITTNYWFTRYLFTRTPLSPDALDWGLAAQPQVSVVTSDDGYRLKFLFPVAATYVGTGSLVVAVNDVTRWTLADVETATQLNGSQYGHMLTFSDNPVDLGEYKLSIVSTGSNWTVNGNPYPFSCNALIATKNVTITVTGTHEITFTFPSTVVESDTGGTFEIQVNGVTKWTNANVLAQGTTDNGLSYTYNFATTSRMFQGDVVRVISTGCWTINSNGKPFRDFDLIATNNIPTYDFSQIYVYANRLEIVGLESFTVHPDQGTFNVYVNDILHWTASDIGYAIYGNGGNSGAWIGIGFDNPPILYQQSVRVQFSGGFLKAVSDNANISYNSSASNYAQEWPVANLIAAPDVCNMALRGQLFASTDGTGTPIPLMGRLWSSTPVGSFRCTYTGTLFTSDFDGGIAGISQRIESMNSYTWAIHGGRYKTANSISYNSTTGPGFFAGVLFNFDANQARFTAAELIGSDTTSLVVDTDSTTSFALSSAIGTPEVNSLPALAYYPLYSNISSSTALVGIGDTTTSVSANDVNETYDDIIVGWPTPTIYGWQRAIFVNQYLSATNTAKNWLTQSIFQVPLDYWVSVDVTGLAFHFVFAFNVILGDSPSPVIDIRVNGIYRWTGSNSYVSRSASGNTGTLVFSGTPIVAGDQVEVDVWRIWKKADGTNINQVSITAINAIPPASNPSNYGSEIVPLMTGDPTGKLARFSSNTPGVSYTNNINFWLKDYDFTGVAVWNSDSPNITGYVKGGTVISPLHAINSTHFAINTGATIKWRASDGTLVTRTIAAINNIDDDICIITLDSALPESIKRYKVGTLLPVETRVALVNQNFECHDCLAVSGSSIFYSADPLFDAWTSGPHGGDSGSPVFALQDGELILLTVQHRYTSGPRLANYETQINAVISPYSLVMSSP